MLGKTGNSEIFFAVFAIGNNDSDVFTDRASVIGLSSSMFISGDTPAVLGPLFGSMINIRG